MAQCGVCTHLCPCQGVPLPELSARGRSGRGVRQACSCVTLEASELHRSLDRPFEGPGLHCIQLVFAASSGCSPFLLPAGPSPV